ncbi:hypothetical protein BKA62DRAFT_670194 [Auriculariales sp. MPI-PUGE-AT-0066]|nr:hypothetical protein BKA62DRAFT_670194 [Auriculariales sp. MPI-PUGE-AT-0066]
MPSVIAPPQPDYLALHTPTRPASTGYISGSTVRANLPAGGVSRRTYQLEDGPKLFEAKVNQATRFKPRLFPGHEGMSAVYACFYPVPRGATAETGTTRAPRRRKSAKSFFALGGCENVRNVAIFLLARWPQVVDSGSFNPSNLSSKTKAGITNYDRSQTVPVSGKGLWDPEVREGLVSDLGLGSVNSWV